MKQLRTVDDWEQELRENAERVARGNEDARIDMARAERNIERLEREQNRG